MKVEHETKFDRTEMNMIRWVCFKRKNHRAQDHAQSYDASSAALTSTWPHLRCDVGLDEGEYWKKNCFCVTVLCTIIMVHRRTSSSYRSVDCIGLWPLLALALCFPSTSVSSVFMVVYLLVRWAWWYWPLMWLTNHHPWVLWHCWLGHLTRTIVPEMTYDVLSGTLNPTIPYHVAFVWRPLLNASCTGIPMANEFVNSFTRHQHLLSFLQHRLTSNRIFCRILLRCSLVPVLIFLKM